MACGNADSGGNGGHILLDAAPVAQLDVLHHVQVDTLGVVDVAVGVAEGHDFRAQLRGLLAGEDGHVAAAGDDHPMALEGLSVGLEHLVGKVAKAVAGGLVRTREPPKERPLPVRTPFSHTPLRRRY